MSTLGPEGAREAQGSGCEHGTPSSWLTHRQLRFWWPSPGPCWPVPEGQALKMPHKGCCGSEPEVLVPETVMLRRVCGCPCPPFAWLPSHLVP